MKGRQVFKSGTFIFSSIYYFEKTNCRQSVRPFPLSIYKLCLPSASASPTAELHRARVLILIRIDFFTIW